MSTKWSLRLLPLLLGLLLIPLFVARIGVATILSELRRLSPESLLILIPYALGTALSAFPWAWCLEPALRPRATATIASRFAASGANALLPFFGLAGEPCRLFWLGREARAEGVAAIVIDRLLYNSAGGPLLLLGAVATLGSRLPLALSGVAAAMGIVLFGLSFCLLYVISRWGMGRRLQRLVQRFSGGSALEPELGARVDAAVQRLARASARRRLVAGLLVHFGARVVLGAEVYVALWSLHAQATLRDALVLASVPIATSVVASSIPSQIGVQEGAQAFVCGALGFSPALGLVLVLLQRMRQLLFAPLTLLLLAAARPRAEAQPE
jgi:hypothetical protein